MSNQIPEPTLVESREFNGAPTYMIRGTMRQVKEPGTWEVQILQYPHPWNHFIVRAEHTPTGSTIEPREDLKLKSLSAARKEAGRTATVLRGTIDDVEWA